MVKLFILIQKGIAIVRYNSFPIFKKAIELGMDVNVYTKGNYPLRYAIMRASPKISNYLWDISGINKTYKDMNGFTIIHNMIDNKQYGLLKKAWEEMPEMFLVRSDSESRITPNITPLELFGNISNEFFTKNSKFKEDIEKIIVSLIKFYDGSDKQEDQDVFYKINTDIKYSNIMQLLRKHTYENLEESLPKSNKVIKKIKL